MPTVAAARLALGRELHELVASNGVSDAILKVRYHLVQEMLASDPLSICEIIPPPAHRTHGRFTIRVRDDCNVRLALAAHDFELGRHMQPPAFTGDSAKPI